MSHPKKFSAEDFMNKMKVIHGDNITLDVSTYKSTKIKARFIDKDFGEWWTWPFVLLKGGQHRKRAKTKLPIPFDIIKERIFLKHGDIVMIDESTYVDTHTKAKFIDKDYGEFWACPTNILRGGEHKERRNDERRIPVEVLVQRVKDIHGDTITLDVDCYTGNKNKKTKFYDKDFGEFYAVLADVLRGYSNRKRGVLVGQKTKIAKYGVPYPQSLPEIKAKIAATNVERYGYPCALQNKDIKEQIRLTNIENYGVENVFANKDIQRKLKNTNLEKYGFENPAQNEGVKDRIKETWMQNYGVTHPFQLASISLKAAETSGKITKIPYWKTGELLRCQAGYEIKTVEHWNENQEEFVWQLVFNIPDDEPIIGGRTYRVDAYLPARDLYVEIKGRWYDNDAKLKWEWFHRTYPNSELWHCEKLFEMGLKIKKDKWRG